MMTDNRAVHAVDRMLDAVVRGVASDAFLIIVALLVTVGVESPRAGVVLLAAHVYFRREVRDDSREG